MTPIAAYSFLIFNLLCAPCFAAIGAIRREMGTWKWTFIAIGFQTLTAYLVALIINQVGSFILGFGSLTGAITSILITLAIVFIVIANGRSSKEKKVSREFSYSK